MMKKLFLFLGICLMMLSGCTSEAEKDSEALKAAMSGGKTEDVAKLASEMYAKKADCDAENLAVLTAGYNYLAEKEMEGANDPANLSDYIEKALECYDAAMKSDAESAKEAFEQLGKANIEKELKELKSNLEQAQAAEQALLEQING